jgi:hypothetical protein
MLTDLADDHETLPGLLPAAVPLLARSAPRSGLLRLLGRARQHEAEQQLAQARLDFSVTLTDLPSVDVLALRRLVETSASLQELWHLRPELYRRLALHHSQAEAERRLGPLERYFRASQRPPR